MNIYKVSRGIMILMTLVFIAPTIVAQEEEDKYEEGTVWNMTIVRTHANATGDYLKGISKTWAASMDKLVEEGMIESYKIFVGEAANDDDFNVLLMTEVKNFSMFDPDEAREKKMDAIQKELRESMGDEFDNIVENYDEIR